ncbi:hypothetical protein C8Q77DRAFT_411649 [Trametes polyzona]|nr:hypothetical protein C8Q77DRAFT_411649 [Trametes polyzona]
MMRAFTILVSVFVLIAPGYSLRAPRGSLKAEVCPGARAISSSTINVGDAIVELAKFSCGARPTVTTVPAIHGLVSALSSTSSAPIPSGCPSPSPQPQNVCGAPCGADDVFCDRGPSSTPNPGPATDDCQTISTAANIISGSISQTFDLEPGHVQSLSFQTCSISFFNGLASNMTNCWLTFAQTALGVGQTCELPANAAGSCFPPDGASWELIIGRSAD